MKDNMTVCILASAVRASTRLAILLTSLALPVTAAAQSPALSKTKLQYVKYAQPLIAITYDTPTREDQPALLRDERIAWVRAHAAGLRPCPNHDTRSRRST